MATSKQTKPTPQKSRSATPASRTLARKVRAARARRKKDAITAALTRSQRRKK